MSAILVIFGIGCTLVGALMLSQATAGVGVICCGIFWAVLARIHQAGEHQRATLAAISQQTDELRHEIREQAKKPPG